MIWYKTAFTDIGAKAGDKVIAEIYMEEFGTEKKVFQKTITLPVH